MLALQRQIIKTFKNYTWDYRFEKNRLKLKRISAHKNCLIRKGTDFISQSLSIPISTPKWIEGNLNKFEEILDQYEKYRLVFSKQNHQLNLQSHASKALFKKHYWQYWTFYLEVEIKGKLYSKSFNLRESKPEINILLNSVKNWTNTIIDFLKTPISNKNQHPDILLFSSGSIGMILHELLGHRLEADDFQTLPKWTKKAKMHFRVFDSPGLPDTTGYTPFGDDGTKGKEVILFDSKNLNSNFLNKKSGNLRTTSALYHPIVRQRNLLTKTLANGQNSPSPDLRFKSYLHIKNISEGIIESSIDSIAKPICHFVVEESTFTNKNGQTVRLAPFELNFSEDDLLNLRLFGEPEVFIPGGGCHKGLQRGLPVSFNCHPGWISL